MKIWRIATGAWAMRCAGQIHTPLMSPARQPVSLEALGNAPLSGRHFRIDDLE